MFRKKPCFTLFLRNTEEDSSLAAAAFSAIAAFISFTCFASFANVFMSTSCSSLLAEAVFFFAKGSCANVNDATIATTAIVNIFFIIVYFGDYLVFSPHRKKSPFIPAKCVRSVLLLYIPISYSFLFQTIYKPAISPIFYGFRRLTALYTIRQRGDPVPPARSPSRHI